MLPCRSDYIINASALPRASISLEMYSTPFSLLRSYVSIVVAPFSGSGLSIRMFPEFTRFFLLLQITLPRYNILYIYYIFFEDI